MKVHRVASAIVGVFALFCLFGGIMGFVKASSLVSLIMGGVSALLLVGGAIGLGKNQRWAALLTLIVSLALGIRFGMAYFHHPKIMPHLIMIVFSLVSLVYSIPILFQSRLSIEE